MRKNYKRARNASAKKHASVEQIAATARRVKAVAESLIEPVPALRYLRRRHVLLEYPISSRTLSNWSRRHILAYTKIGRTVLFKRDDIEAALSRYRRAAIGEPHPRTSIIETTAIARKPATPRKRRAGRLQAIDIRGGPVR